MLKIAGASIHSIDCFINGAKIKDTEIYLVQKLFKNNDKILSQQIEKIKAKDGEFQLGVTVKVSNNEGSYLRKIFQKEALQLNINETVNIRDIQYALGSYESFVDWLCDQTVINETSFSGARDNLGARREMLQDRYDEEIDEARKGYLGVVDRKSLEIKKKKLEMQLFMIQQELNQINAKLTKSASEIRPSMKPNLKSETFVAEPKYSPSSKGSHESKFILRQLLLREKPPVLETLRVILEKISNSL